MKYKSSDDTKFAMLDHAEHILRIRADEQVLEALAREHADRATASHPPGTKAPKSMPMPGAPILKSNFD
jgi:hypothetical protein